MNTTPRALIAMMSIVLGISLYSCNSSTTSNKNSTVSQDTMARKTMDNMDCSKWVTLKTGKKVKPYRALNHLIVVPSDTAQKKFSMNFLMMDSLLIFSIHPTTKGADMTVQKGSNISIMFTDSTSIQLKSSNTASKDQASVIFSKANKNMNMLDSLQNKTVQSIRIQTTAGDMMQVFNEANQSEFSADVNCITDANIKAAKKPVHRKRHYTTHTHYHKSM